MKSSTRHCGIFNLIKNIRNLIWKRLRINFLQKISAMTLILLVILPAHAVMPDERLADPALEARARAISQELRCLVCQNQSIDDSDASIAKDLRLLVRERLKAGENDAQVKEFIRARYGDFVLLKPPLNASTLLLWFLPFSILGLAGVLIYKRYQQNPYKEE